jgi:hypothetical protein
MGENEPKKKGCGGCLTKLITAFVIMVILPAALITWGMIEERKRQEAAWQKALHVHQELKQAVDRYAAFKKSEEFEFFAPYAERENWDALFKKAEKGVGEIVSSFIAREDLSLGERLPGILEKIEAVKASIGEVKKRMARLETLREETPDKVAAAELQIPITDRIIDDLQGRIAEVKSDFPDRAGDVDSAVGAYTPLPRILVRSKTALEAAKAERAKMETDAFVDYVRMNQGVGTVFTKFSELQDIDAKLRAKLDELYRSYSKTLVDMKADYYLVIGRATWDNDSDYDYEKTFTYPPVPVSAGRYEYFTKLDPTKELATLHWNSGRFRAAPVVAKDQWNALKLYEGQGVDRSDDAGVFWLEDAPVKTYHKYRVTENGTVKETDWVEVDEEDYGELYDYLGMTVVNKPYGFFEDEAVRVAAPPGMAFVGINRYGRWADDPATGDSYWEWDDDFDDAFEIDIDIGKKHRYSRKEWRTWRSDFRGKKPYYGKSADAGPPLFGTNGSRVRKDSRFQKSAFVAAGGLAAAAGSFRGAGPSRRGRGPGGFGK